MTPLTLTKQQARRFVLAHQGLWPPRAQSGPSGVMAIIRRLGCIQFDPLDVVGRNPELVLQARVRDFRPEMLDALLYDDRKLVDGWDHNMAIYPVEDWPYFRRQRERVRRNPGKSAEAVEAVLPQVRAAIEARGPLSSLDLDFDQTVDWSWAPTRLARAALDSMYGWGELIVHHKVHTRKVYDFAHRHIPEALLTAPDPNETEEAYQDWYVRRRLGAVGLMWDMASSAWRPMTGIKSPGRSAALQRLREAGKVVEVRVEGIEPPLYARRRDEDTLDAVLHGEAPPPYAALIAPLDNLIWDRRFVETLFDFEYRWEVYTPVEKRVYGYYVLPVLYNDRFVARFEPDRDAPDGVLGIKGWWWEGDAAPSSDMRRAVRQAFAAFLDYLGADVLQVADEVREEANLQWLEPRRD
jgi:uncharacterized protein YcaQ